MQTERQFGFLAITDFSVKHEEYLEFKEKLERVCKEALHMAQHYSQKDICFTYRLRDMKFFSIYIKNESLLIGIFDLRNKKILLEYPYAELEKLFFDRFEDIELVSKNYIKELSLGRPTHLPEVANIWTNTLEQMEAAKSPQTAKEDLHLISKDFFNNEEVCLDIVRNPNVSQQTLYCLAHNPYISVKVEITKLQRVHPKVLRVLLNDPQVGGYAELHPGYAKIMKQKQNTFEL